MNTLGVSGSTILSDEKLFDELFDYQLSHIEIGEFKNRRTFKRFIRMLDNSLLTFGIHSPIIRGKSKYDLIENVFYSPEEAIVQVEKEVKRAKYLGAKYLLVHFPFFADTCDGDTDKMIEDGLKKLSAIQKKYSLDIVCEPKIGRTRSPMGIEYLNRFSVDTWRKYNLKICVDIGDYVMAVGDEKVLQYISKWEEFVRVVHLHNVDYPNGDYFWKPMHPDDESDGYHKIEGIIKHLAKLDNIYFVLEHTPHMNYDWEYIMEGRDYVDGLVKKS